jgi:hypothetical protein
MSIYTDVEDRGDKTANTAKLDKQVFDAALLRLANSRAFPLADIRKTKKGQQKELRQQERNR